MSYDFSAYLISSDSARRLLVPRFAPEKSLWLSLRMLSWSFLLRSKAPSDNFRIWWKPYTKDYYWTSAGKITPPYSQIPLVPPLPPEYDAYDYDDTNHLCFYFKYKKETHTKPYHPVHLQIAVHGIPAWKHSQYFLMHPDFLQEHP